MTKTPTYPSDDPRSPHYRPDDPGSARVPARGPAPNAEYSIPYETLSPGDYATQAQTSSLTGAAPAPKGPVFEMAIGDINSTAKGSGARANGGKPPLELIPLRLLAQSMNAEAPGHMARVHGVTRVHGALSNLSSFQETHDAAFLLTAINLLHDPDDHISPFTHWYECAAVLDYGRKKYAAWNWLKGMPWSACVGSAARHLLDMIVADSITVPDHESGLPLRGHVMCNLMFLLQYTSSYPEGNDLPPKECFK